MLRASPDGRGGSKTEKHACVNICTFVKNADKAHRCESAFLLRNTISSATLLK